MSRAELPLFISVPHAGLRVPGEVASWVVLSAEQIARDGDAGAAGIYGGLRETAAGYLEADVARAIVDLNRAPDDRRPDGVVKTHTCFNEPVYEPFPPEELVESLIQDYYVPYHEELSRAGGRGDTLLGVDCHTMAAEGPPVGPDPGSPRPLVCLSNADGTCPDSWLTALAEAFMAELGDSVGLNHPFTGGYITRHHAREMPWVQIELSRSEDLSPADKRHGVEEALRAFCRRAFE